MPTPEYSGLLSMGNVAVEGAGADDDGGPFGDGCVLPRALKDLVLWAGKLVNDQRAGVAVEPSGNPTSNLFAHPSSVCLVSSC